jgi:glycosyltransferase involved in cell wall biosynthesis
MTERNSGVDDFTEQAALMEQIQLNYKEKNYILNTEIARGLNFDGITYPLDLYEKLAISCYRLKDKQLGGDIYRKMLIKAQADDTAEVAGTAGSPTKGTPVESPATRLIDEIEARYDHTYDTMKYFYEPSSDPIGKVALVCYKTPAVPAWDPSATRTGLTGSEEAVVYAARVLAEKGYEVLIFANPPAKSTYTLPLNNPRYLDISVFDTQMIDNRPLGTFEMAVAWRRCDFVNVARISSKVYFWSHDMGSYKFSTERLSGCLLLSQYHKSTFDRHVDLNEVPITYSGNGIVPAQFSKPKRFTNPYSCLYASSYSRGLMILLELWPDVLKQFPEATLDVYYGRQTWGALSEQGMQQIDQKFKELADKGVTERGKVGHVELAEAMQTASVLAYPCDSWAETFCITVVKAQAAGMIPVTTRVGSLKEMVHPEAPTLEQVDNSAESKAQYLELLLTTLRQIKEPETELLRDKLIAFGSQFTWLRTVDMWLELHNKLVAQDNA